MATKLLFLIIFSQLKRLWTIKTIEFMQHLLHTLMARENSFQPKKSLFPHIVGCGLPTLENWGVGVEIYILIHLQYIFLVCEEMKKHYKDPTPQNKNWGVVPTSFSKILDELMRFGILHSLIRMQWKFWCGIWWNLGLLCFSSVCYWFEDILFELMV